MTNNTRERADGSPSTAVRERIPMGVPTLQLDRPNIKGFFCRWFNDEPGRIERVLAAGYEFVNPEEAPGFGISEVTPGNSDLGTRISRVVGVSDTGTGPLRAYLMKIRQEWYDTDQQTKQAELDKLDVAIAGGAIGPSDKHRYIKDISYQNR